MSKLVYRYLRKFPRIKYSKARFRSVYSKVCLEDILNFFKKCTLSHFGDNFPLGCEQVHVWRNWGCPLERLLNTQTWTSLKSNNNCQFLSVDLKAKGIKWFFNSNNTDLWWIFFFIIVSYFERLVWNSNLKLTLKLLFQAPFYIFLW